jgi:hypothetical protein
LKPQRAGLQWLITKTFNRAKHVPLKIICLIDYGQKHKFNFFDIITTTSAALETTLKMVLMKNNPYGLFFISKQT